MIGLFFIPRALAAGGILALAWWSMGKVADNHEAMLHNVEPFQPT
jgi:hypothetical protein